MSNVPTAHIRQLLVWARTILSDPLFQTAYEAARKIAADSAGARRPRKAGRPPMKALNPFAVAVARTYPGIPARKLPAALGLPSWSEEADERRVERARQGLRGLEQHLDSIIAHKVAEFGRKTGLPPFLVSWLLDDAGDPMPLDSVLKQIDAGLANLGDASAPTAGGTTSG